MKTMLRSSRLFRLSLLIGLLGFINMAVFTMWRWNKPLDNPGGPLASLGSWVVAWEISRSCMIWISILGMNVAIYQHKKQDADRSQSMHTD